MFPFDKHTRLRESLSAYIDNALNQRDRAALEAHLSRCETCRAELEALQATSDAVRALPAVAAPRSFALTPRMAGTPGRASAGRLPALDSVMRLSAASLAVALASVMVVDRAELGGNNNEADTELARVGFQSPLSEFSSSSEDEQSGPADATGLGDMESAERSFDTVTGAVPAEDAGGAAGGTPVTQDDFGTVRDADAASPQASANAEIVGEAVPLDQEDSVTAARQFEDEDGGIGVIGVAEVVLAVLFGSALGGVLALGFARRRQQREGTNAPG